MAPPSPSYRRPRLDCKSAAPSVKRPLTQPVIKRGAVFSIHAPPRRGAGSTKNKNSYLDNRLTMMDRQETLVFAGEESFMKRRIPWLYSLALLMVSQGSLMAQNGSDVREWLTTADRSALLAEQKAPLPFSSPSNSVPPIDVNDMQQFQPIDGFGFALTGGSAQLLMRMEPGPRADLLKDLFAPSATAV